MNPFWTSISTNAVPASPMAFDSRISEGSLLSIRTRTPPWFEPPSLAVKAFGLTRPAPTVAGAPRRLMPAPVTVTVTGWAARTPDAVALMVV